MSLMQLSASRHETPHPSSVIMALINAHGEHAGPSTQVLFEHIPKTAGTGIEDAANRSDPRLQWGRFVPGGYMQSMPDGSHCSQHHVPARLLENRMLRDEYRNAKVFCVVRNPYERIVSEYSYRLSVHGVPKHFRQQTECTPDGLNYFVQQALLAYVNGKPFAFDCHLLPQHEYIYSEGEQWCNKVLKMEDFPGNFNKLMEENGIEVNLDDKKSFSFDQRCPQLSVKDLTPESMHMIEAAYAEDFDFLKSDHLNHYASKGDNGANDDVMARATAARPAVTAALQDYAAVSARVQAAVTALTIDPFGLKGLA